MSSTGSDDDVDRGEWAVRATTLGLSIAAHGAVGITLALLAAHERPMPPVTTTTIELVAAPPFAPPPPPPPPASTSSSPPPIASVSQARMRAPMRARTRSVRDHVGEVGIDAGVVGDDHGTGRGGTGFGRGIGLGEGGRLMNQIVMLAPPPAPPASKARTATLVYPVREREVDDSELFIARVTIDDEGYVVGAKLVRGFGGPRDAEAADLIWKFRYAPALDDDGRAVSSTFDQRFLVGR